MLEVIIDRFEYTFEYTPERGVVEPPFYGLSGACYRFEPLIAYLGGPSIWKVLFLLRAHSISSRIETDKSGFVGGFYSERIMYDNQGYGKAEFS